MRFLLLICLGTLFGCGLGEAGKVVLVNRTGQPFYYRLAIEEEFPRADSLYSFPIATKRYPLLEPDEETEVDIRGQYDQDDMITLLVFAAEAGQDTAHVVKTEAAGVRFMEDTFWQPWVVR